jgi:hypothetical protein
VRDTSLNHNYDKSIDVRLNAVIVSIILGVRAEISICGSRVLRSTLAALSVY